MRGIILEHNAGKWGLDIHVFNNMQPHMRRGTKVTDVLQHIQCTKKNLLTRLPSVHTQSRYSQLQPHRENKTKTKTKKPPKKF